MQKTRLWKLLAVLALGAAPLATVSTCDYGPDGGTFFYDQIGGGGDDDDDDDDDDGYYEDDCCGYYDDCCDGDFLDDIEDVFD